LRGTGVALGLALTLGMAVASYYGLERYFLKLKKHGSRTSREKLKGESRQGVLYWKA